MATVKDIEAFTPDITSSYGEGLTKEVTTFILETSYEAIPEEVIDLSKKSILDGLGLALSGSVAERSEASCIRDGKREGNSVSEVPGHEREDLSAHS